jgi:hypothetical protein
VGDLTPQAAAHVESVHRLSNLGAVVTQAGHGISQEGLDAEWRMVAVFTVDGEMISRCELYDEADLDAALARFDELDRLAPRLENAASQLPTAAGRFWRPATGTHWRKPWPPTITPTIAVEG